MVNNMNPLAVVEAARRRCDNDHQRLIQAVRDAAAAGVPIAHVATAADVSRPTVYRWISEPDDD